MFSAGHDVWSPWGKTSDATIIRVYDRARGSIQPNRLSDAGSCSKPRAHRDIGRRDGGAAREKELVEPVPEPDAESVVGGPREDFAAAAGSRPPWQMPTSGRGHPKLDGRSS
jgi:hypothetical protein